MDLALGEQDRPPFHDPPGPGTIGVPGVNPAESNVNR